MSFNPLEIGISGIDGVKSALSTIYRYDRYAGQKRIPRKLDSGQIVDIPEDVHKQYFKDVNKDKSVKLRILPKKKD